MPPKNFFYGHIADFKKFIKFNEKLIDIYYSKGLLTNTQYQKIKHNNNYAEETLRHQFFFFKEGEKWYGIPICTELKNLKGVNSIDNIKSDSIKGDSKNIKYLNYDGDPNNIKIVLVLNEFGFDFEVKSIKMESLENNPKAIIGRFGDYDKFFKLKKAIEALEKKDLAKENIASYFKTEQFINQIVKTNEEKGLIKKNNDEL